MTKDTKDNYSDTAERVLLLYALSKMGSPISREEFAPVLLSSGGSWIDLQLRIDSMISENLAEEHDGDISITPDGIEVLQVYRDRLPDKSTDNVDHYLEMHRTELRDKLYIKAGFERSGPGYLVRLSMAENGQTLLSVEIDAPTRDQAVAVCDHWKKEPQRIYSEMIRILTT
ncbi:MAG: DUF4364 family protein [Eubacteriaceae bacterium]|jgi:hypothetical protein